MMKAEDQEEKDRMLIDMQRNAAIFAPYFVVLSLILIPYS